ncbi:MAG: DUF6599 family protein [Desulfobacterales bacterium]
MKKECTRREACLSFSILFVLAGIGIIVFLQQFRYSPAILSTGMLNQNSKKIQGSYEEIRENSLILLPKNYILLSPPEMFQPHNLSDKIDGKAELYLSAGFKTLESQRFKTSAASEDWAEIFIYDMGNGENAFSVFSEQMREDAKPVGLDQYSYRTENAVYYVYGPYYVEIISSVPTDESVEKMVALGHVVIQNMPIKTTSIVESKLFPRSGLETKSIALISTNAFGFDQFNRVYVAKYKIDKIEMTAFLSHRKTSQKARALGLGYYRFLLTFGGKAVEQPSRITGAKIISIMDSYEIIFSFGRFVAGVREASDRKQAMELAHRLRKGLKAVVDGE